jgi:phosphatidate cytidylyltransferase
MIYKPVADCFCYKVNQFRRRPFINKPPAKFPYCCLKLFVLLPVICAFVTDAGAYFTGIAVGRRKVFPLISPKKTLEGCIGGLVAGVVAVVLYGVFLVFETTHEVDLLVLALYGLVGALMTELGDVAFSLVKRECDVKDFGRLLPGHGGMLDRFDSMVFAAPAMYLLVSALPAIYVVG